MSDADDETPRRITGREPADYPRLIVLPPPEGRARRWPHLVLTNYPVLGEVFRLVHPETIVGRADDADVRPHHGRISRHHARLTILDDRVVIEDLGSTHGTRIGDEPLLGR